MEIHLYRLDDIAFRLIIVGGGETIHRGLFEAKSYSDAIAHVALVIRRLEADGKLATLP